MHTPLTAAHEDEEGGPRLSPVAHLLMTPEGRAPPLSLEASPNVDDGLLGTSATIGIDNPQARRQLDSKICHFFQRVRSCWCVRHVRCMVTVTLLVAIPLLLGFFQKPLLRLAVHYRMGIVEQGVPGAFLVEFIFIVWVLLLLPTTGFELLVAFTYGFFVCCVISVIAKTVSSILVFLVARRCLRARAQKVVQDSLILTTLYASAEQHSLKAACLVRLAYVPLAIKNIGLSAFPVSLGCFSLSTILITIPYAICWAWLGSTIQKVTDDDGELHIMGHWQAIVALSVGLAFTVLLFAISFYLTRRIYAHALHLSRPDFASLEDAAAREDAAPPGTSENGAGPPLPSPIYHCTVPGAEAAEKDPCTV